MTLEKYFCTPNVMNNVMTTSPLREKKYTAMNAMLELISATSNYCVN